MPNRSPRGFEPYAQPLLPRSRFLIRLVRHGGMAGLFLLFAPIVHRAMHRFHMGG